MFRFNFELFNIFTIFSFSIELFSCPCSISTVLNFFYFVFYLKEIFYDKRNLFRPSETSHAGEQFKQVDLIRAAQRRGVKLGKSHVSQYVSGKTVPRSDILHFLADVLQVDPDWLLAKDSTVNYTADTVSDSTESCSDPSAASLSQTKTGGSPMREFKKSSKLDQCLI